MRWKWLLLLSLISISLVVASGDVEKVDEAVKDNADEDNYDDDDQQGVVVETEMETDAPTHDDPSDDTVKAEDPTNEDTVDVEDVPISKQQGKYMNYDDYNSFASAMDQSDSSYDWNSKCPTPAAIDWHI